MEFYRMRERLDHGIPIAPAVVKELRRVADDLKLSDRLD